MRMRATERISRVILRARSRDLIALSALAAMCMEACVPHLMVGDGGIDAVDLVTSDVPGDTPVDAAPACSFGQPQAIVIGAPATGMLSGMLSANASTTCMSTTAGTERVYFLDLPARTGLIIDLQRTDPLPDGGFTSMAVVALRRACEMQSTEIACSQASAAGSMTRPTRTVVDPGRYFFVVDTALGSAGMPETVTFRLTVTTYVPSPNSSCSTPAAFAASDPAATGDTTFGGPGLTTCDSSPSGATNYYRATIPPQSRLTVTGTPGTTANPADVVGISIVDNCANAACFSDGFSAPAMATSPPMPAVPAVATAYNDTDAPQDVIVGVSGQPAMGDGVSYSLTTATHANAYRVSSIPVACDDTAPGTLIAPMGGPPWLDDSASGVAMLPVPVTFFGVSHAAFSIASNGFMQLWPTTSGMPVSTYINALIPSPNSPPGIIAPFWDDLAPNSVPVGEIRMLRIVDATPRTVFSWNNWTIYSESSSLLTFQVHLVDTGVIEFHYCLLAITSGTSQPDRVYGSSATIGIQNDTGTDAVQHAFARRNIVASATALRFTPVP